MRKVNLLIIMVLALGLLGAMVGCGETTPTPTATPIVTPTATPTVTPTATPTATPTPTPVEPIKIGLLDDVTGPVGGYGTAFMAGSKVAIQMVNDAGGIKSLGGAKIVFAEGAGDSTVATSVAEIERLITAEKVIAISGPTSTGEALACIPLFERYKIPAVTLLSDYEQFQKGYRYIFGPVPTMQSMGVYQADFFDFMVKKYGAPTDKIAVCTMTPAYVTMSETLVARLTELGYKNIVVNETFPATVTDQTPLVMKLKAASVSLVMYNGAASDAIAFHKACYTYDYYPWLITHPGALGQTNVRVGLPPDIVEKTLTRPNAFCVGCNIATDAYEKIASLKTFQDALQKAYPGNTFDPSITPMGATKIFVLAKALEDAASRNPEDIAAALRKVDIQAPSPYLVWADEYPRITMTDSGLSSTGSAQAAQWSDDLKTLQAIWPESLASTTPRVQK